MILNSQKVQMIECFVLNTDEKITASQIAKHNNFSQKSVYLFMEELEKEGILISKIQGKNKLYELNKVDKILILQFISTIEHLRTLFFYQKYPNIKIIIQKIIPHIDGIAVIFGSYAKGKQKDMSDIDLYIAGNYKQKKILDIVETFNIEINIKHQKKFNENTLTKEIKKNHIILKETEQFLLEVNKWIK
jgi:predicted nucleotidyltransferase